MRVRLTKTFRFEAAHDLPTFPEGHKCRRLHGHSFRFDVVVEGDVDPKLGYLIDYGDIKKAAEHIFDVLTVGRADAALAASIFHFNTTTVGGGEEVFGGARGGGAGGVTFMPRRSGSGQEGIELALERGQFGLDDIPRLAVVDGGVGVDEDVAKADDGAPVGDGLGDVGFDLAELGERFAG